MCVHGEKKSFYGIFVIVSLLTIVLLIVSLPIPWLGGKIENEYGTYTYEVTLSNVKVKGNGTLWESKETINIHELCDEASFNLTSCGVDGMSFVMILFTVIGLILSFGTWLAVFMDLRCNMSKHYFFNLIVCVPIAFQFIIYFIMFVIYSDESKEFRKHGLHFHAGWALYFIGMIGSLVMSVMAFYGTSIRPVDC